MKKRTSSTKPYLITATVVVLLYLLSASGMSLLEQETSRSAQYVQFFYAIHSRTPTMEEKQYVENILGQTVTERQMHIPEIIVKQSQKLIDSVTPGTTHCESEYHYYCGYQHKDTTQNILQFIDIVSGPDKAGAMEVTQITPADHLLKISTLLIEALLLIAIIKYGRSIIRRKWK